MLLCRSQFNTQYKLATKIRCHASDIHIIHKNFIFLFSFQFRKALRGLENDNKS